MTLRPSTELDTSRLHITSNSMGGKSHLYGVQNHLWTNRMERTVIDDLIDGVSVEQAVCQMARYTDQDSLTMIMDWLTCANADLRQSTPQRLREAIDGFGRFPGIRRCRAALSRSVPGTDSPQETLLRLRMIGAGLPCPLVNHEIPDIDASTVWRVDMAYPPERVAIEYDGEYHYDRHRWRSDLRKRNRLQDLGWTVLVAVKDVLNDERRFTEFLLMIIHARLRGASS